MINSQEFVRRKVKRINQIVDEFYQEINSLKKKQHKIISKILSRVDKEKIEKILKEL